MNDILKNCFQPVKDKFEPYFGGTDEQVLIYLGMHIDIIKALYTTNAKIIVSICNTDVSLNNIAYPNKVTALSKYKNILQMSIIIQCIIRELKAVGVYDTDLTIFDEHKFIIKFTFQNESRKLIYYNNKDYKVFFPDNIDTKDKTLIIVSWGSPTVKQKHATYEKYNNLILESKNAFTITDSDTLTKLPWKNVEYCDYAYISFPKRVGDIVNFATHSLIDGNCNLQDVFKNNEFEYEYCHENTLKLYRLKL